MLCGLVLAVVGEAAAQPKKQDVRRPESGYIGKGTGTEELDQCRREAGLTEAQTRSRASEHFTRGINLYKQGDYRAAIDEWVLSYCHIPHEDTLKNISEAFERLVDYEKAVAYLERYILENRPEARSQRRTQAAYVDVLRNLHARVSIATEPESASVTLVGETGRSADGVSNSETPIRVRKGVYTMTIEKEKYETITETIEVKIGQPYSYFFQLKPKKGTLRVATVPETANIFIGDRRVAIGTYVDQLPVGKYVVSAEVPGLDVQRREVDITDGSVETMTLELKPKPRSGRLDLLLAATVAGGWAGSSVAALLSNRGEVVGGGLPVGLAIGFGGAYLGVPRDISVGISSYLIGTTVMASLTGGVLGYHFTCGNSETETSCDNTVLATALAGGVAGLLGSALTAETLKLRSGDAALINSGALWGTSAGSLFWVVFGRQKSLVAPLVLSGLGLGTVTGALLARGQEVSRRHVALIDVSGALGVLVGAAIADVVDQGSGISERIPHIALLGMAVGLITGTYLTRHIDEPASLRVSPGLGAAQGADGATTMTMGVQGSF